MLSALFARARLWAALWLAASSLCMAAPAPSRMLEWARSGKVEAIYAVADQNPRNHNDLEAYKWLAVADDFGHRKARALMEELQEVSSLRNDDDQLAVSTVHHELGMAYLTASEGLAQDFAKAQKHFRLASRGIRHVQINLEADRARLSGKALQIFSKFYPPAPSGTRKR